MTSPLRKEKMMISLKKTNYFSPEASRDYWSVSQFKSFDRCEAAGLASVKGEYEREITDALLIGSYVDAYFSDELDEFVGEHANDIYQKNGKLYSKFEHANEIIHRVRSDHLMMNYLTGEKQVIMSAEIFDVPWKIKIDVHGGNRIVDLKCVKDFQDVYDPGYGYRPWIEYWGYDIQGAIYQKVEQLYSGRSEPLPFYIAAVTKEKVPDIAVIQLPQYVLDTAYKVVESKIDKFDLIKHGEINPSRCEKCDYCKRTKMLTEPSIYEAEC